MTEPRLLYSKTSQQHEVVVVEDGTVRYLFFNDVGSHEIISRMDMTTPSKLLAPYSQAMGLALAWTRPPLRVYLIGLGAGRLPYFFESFAPDCSVECTEIDDDVHDIAREFFGLDELRNLTVVLNDGRTHLESLESTPRFDCILIDAFNGTGSTPRHLSTVQFYESCRRRLDADGVVVLNIIGSDESFADKVETLRQSFEHLHRIEIGHSNIFFASDRPFDHDHLEATAIEIDAAYPEPATFRSLAQSLQPVTGPIGAGAEVLIDGAT